MSAIPPGWLGGVIQAHGASSRASEARTREESAKAEAAGETAARHVLTDAISNSEQDSNVFADGHGAGGQGRATRQPEEERAEGEKETGGEGGLDVEA